MSLDEAFAVSHSGLLLALLTGILSDLATLKEQLRGQATFNAAINGFVKAAIEGNAIQATMNAEAGRFFATHGQLVEQVNQLTAALVDIDTRLSAIDGKRSITICSAGL